MTITIGKTVRACGMSYRHNVRPNPDVLWLIFFLNVSVKPSVHLRISRSTSEFHDWSLSEQPFGPTKINNFIFLIHKRDREPTLILSVPGKVKTRCLGPQTRPDLTRDAQTQSVILKRTATLLVSATEWPNMSPRLLLSMEIQNLFIFVSAETHRIWLRSLKFRFDTVGCFFTRKHLP